jgi:citrate synthase
MNPGLEGVVAAQTILSHTDRAGGMVWVRGIPLPQLVTDYGFDGMVALLWNGVVGDNLTRDGIRAAFGAARVAAFPEVAEWLDRYGNRSLYDAIRIYLALQPDEATPVQLHGGLSVALPALLRARAGQQPIAPDPSLSTPDDLLRMWHGTSQDAANVAALDAYFTVMCESGLSASVFTSRVVASTRASLTAAMTGAWCAFTGPLHGGAPGPTLDLLDEAAGVDDMVGWVEGRLRAGERLMGFGHRVFQGNDPRAAEMRKAMQRMGPTAGRLAFAAKVEAAVAQAVERVKPGRKLPPNLEITAALLLDAVGFPREAFTPVFAIGRTPGWLAHAVEQQKTGRMYRPASAYVGPPIPGVTG